MKHIDIQGLGLAALGAASLAGVAAAAPQDADFGDFACGFRPDWADEFRAAVARGEVRHPASRLPVLIPDVQLAEQLGEATPCMTSASIFPYEDSAQLLLTDFSDGELIDLLIDAANDLMSVHGDNYDFVGFWTNFVADHEIGAAFYLGISNDTEGIGLGLADDHALYGLGGTKIQGLVMMWDVNHTYWAAGTNSSADFTRLALAQEFEHRFAMFLPDLLDGRQLQGDSLDCGRAAHWSWKVDGQGSGMEISEWVGSNPATLAGSFVTFNTDIPGSVFSYSDLYLMGYVSAAEMDAGNSELRYMNDSDCFSLYNGAVTTFDSSDIIAAAGPRVPGTAAAQKNFRTAWIMIHQPGDPGSAGELGKAVSILEQHMTDWNQSTLGRGTMNDTLFDECHGVTAYGSVNPAGSLTLINGQPGIGTTMTLGIENPLGTQSAGSNTFLIFSADPDPAFPNGTLLPNFGMGGPGADGELLISLAAPNPTLGIVGPPLPGSGPAEVDVPLPANVALFNMTFYGQALIDDPTVALGVRLALTNALAITIGP